MAYLSLVDAKEWLGIPGATSGHDDLITALILVAQERIDAVCNTTFEAVAETRYFDVPKSARLLRLGQDLVSVTSITNGDGTALAATDYKLYPLNQTPKHTVKLLFSSGYYWTWDDDPEGAIAINGSWGYSSAVPKQIEQATKELVAFLYRLRDGDGGEVQFTASGGILRVPSGIPTNVLDMLKPYQRMI